MLGLWVASFSGVSVSGLLRHGAPTKWAQVQGKRLALPHTPRAPHSLSDDMFMRPGGEAMSLVWCEQGHLSWEDLVTKEMQLVVWGCVYVVGWCL